MWDTPIIILKTFTVRKISMNIYDIAKEAGVSIATVSRVVNGKSTVSRKTREKVEAVLKKYNYAPDPNARGLVVKFSKSVAILTEDICIPFFGNVSYAVERGLRGEGFSALLYNTGGTAETISESIKSALSQKVSAVVVAGMPKQAESEIIKAAESVPVVLVNHFLDAKGVYLSVCDECYGMMLAVARLVRDGRLNIIYVQDSSEEYFSTNELIRGFQGGMEMNGLSPEGRIVKTERGCDGGYACAEELTNGSVHFDGVICGDDTTAAGFISCLRRKFIDVPEDVSVIGFHNTKAAECCAPPLTSVDCRGGKTGEAAVKILKSILKDGTAEQKTIVLPRLVIRGSA